MAETERTRLIAAYNENALRLGWPGHIDTGLAFEAPSLSGALEMWRWRANGSLPRRCQLTPRVLKPFITEVAMFDVVREGGRIRYRARVIGSDLALRYGHLPGKFIDEWAPSPFRERWQAVFKLALDVAGPIRATGAIEFCDQSHMRIEALFAPLAEPSGPPDTIFMVGHVSCRPISTNL